VTRADGARTPSVLLAVDGESHIATLTLNRPEALNAISRQLAAELLATCNGIADRDDIWVVIVTGAGERAFCAGADLKERRMLSSGERTAHTTAIEAAAEALAALPMPTIAAVRGFALAGGAELAIACDLRVAADDATFGFPEVKVGIFPGSALHRATNTGERGVPTGLGRPARASRVSPGECRRVSGLDRGERAASRAGSEAGLGGESRHDA
jgi:enoyl-CoA hydratase/carnithine racemase